MNPLAILLVVVLALAAGAAEGAPAPGPARPPAAGGEKKREPIHVTSDRMEAYNQKNLVIFLGKVKAVQGELSIESDRLEVYIKKREKEADGVVGPPSAAAPSPASRRASLPGAGRGGQDGEDAGGSVERIVAIGHVLVNQNKTKFASGGRLDYSEETGIGVLTVNPRAWEGQNLVIGDKIELFLKEDRTVVHGTASRRVNVTLYPDEERPAGSSPSASPSRRPQAKGPNAPPQR